MTVGRAAVPYEKLARIRMIFLDVDGVLTDGQLTLTSADSGDLAESKSFNAHDGQGLIAAAQMGYEIGIVTSRKSELVSRRALELGIKCVLQNVKEKLPAVKAHLKSRRRKFSELLYIGDDLLDIPVLESAGFSATVPEAPLPVRRCVDYVTDLSAGRGAVREVLEMLFKIQGKWAGWIGTYCR